MKVTVLSSLPPQRGITPYTLHLLQALVDHGSADIDVLGFSSLYPQKLYPGGAPDRREQGNTPVPARRLLSWWNPISWVRGGMAVRGDILHVQWWSWFLAAPYCTVMSIAQLRGKRVVLTAHNTAPHERSLWKRALNDLVIRRADQIIVHAERNRVALTARGHEGERISVVPHGILGIAHEERVPSREEARTMLGIEPRACVVLLFGNLRPYKGVRVLVEAAARMREQVPNLRVVIAGERWNDCSDPASDAAAAGVADISDLRMGYVPGHDVPALFAAADAVALPYTHFDGQSGAGTLALSAGRALVVSDVGGLRELTRDARAIVPPGDADALARALTAVLTDRGFREKLERDAQIVAEELSWTSIAHRTVGVYERVLGRSAADSMERRNAA